MENSKNLIRVLKKGSIHVPSDEIRRALLDISTAQNLEGMNEFFDAFCSSNRFKHYSKEVAFNLAVCSLDSLAGKADEIYTNEMGEGTHIQTYVRKYLDSKLALLS